MRIKSNHFFWKGRVISMKTLIIIQARMGSSRLPGKVLMPLGSSIVLNYVVSRCRQVKNVQDVIVATSTLEQDNPIAQWCKQNQVTYFRGSENDVLLRYYDCAKSYKPDYIIRVTADCPFVDYDLANSIVNTMEQNPSDIVILKGERPRGLEVEMISYSALEHINKLGKEPRHREHVTYYAHEFPHNFQQTQIKLPDYLNAPELRITLDTEEDYQLCQAIADHFKDDELISSQDVVEFLFERPDVAKLNMHVKQKPVL
jgi:spore coat polysaccharide biosynthesis protein SpsF